MISNFTKSLNFFIKSEFVFVLIETGIIVSIRKLVQWGFAYTLLLYNNINYILINNYGNASYQKGKVSKQRSHGYF